MVHILVTVAGNAAVRLPKDFFPRTEAQTIRRASLHAGWRDNALAVQIALVEGQCLSVAGQGRRLVGPIRTMSTLLYFRGKRVPFRRGYSPRTRPDAVAAADAFVRIIDDGSIGSAIQGRCRTGRGTRWL